MPPRLLAFAAQLHSFTLATQDPVPYTIQAWQQQFGDDGDLQAIHEHLGGQITRANLQTLATQAFNPDGHFRRLFLATMMWGFGNRGYGAWRTSQMLGVANADEAIHTTATQIQDGQLVDAYNSSNLPWCGPSFFTKFLYSLGLGCDGDTLPLIYDERVALSLARLAQDGGFNLADFAPNATGYANYVRTVNNWAVEIGCRQDAIEFLLFDPAQAFWLWHN